MATWTRTSSRFAIVLLASVGALAPASCHPAKPERLWFKGNLHAHSLRSDGAMLPEDLINWYANHGYQFLGLSEHNTVADDEAWAVLNEPQRSTGDSNSRRQSVTCRPQRRLIDGVEQWRLAPFSELRERCETEGSFLLLQDEEITSDLGSQRIHVTAVNVPDAIAPSDDDNPAVVLEQNLQRVELKRQQYREPMIAVVNHPNFTWAIGPAELAGVKVARFVEVFNGHPFAASRGDTGKRPAARLWDVANAERVLQRGWPPLYGVASDDTHALTGAAEASPGRGWIMVRAAKLSSDQLLTAMNAGEFYASTGVALRECDYDARTRNLTVAVAPIPGVSYQIDFIVTKLSAKPSESSSVEDRWDVPAVGMLARRVVGLRAGYALAPDDAYVRATVTATSLPRNPMQSNYAGDGAQFEQAFTQPVGWERSSIYPTIRSR